MFDTTKFDEFFDSSKIEDAVHIIGCGAIGSHIAEQLARLDIKNIHLWDFDTVSAHNIANQYYRNSDINTPKVEALQKELLEINPEINITLHKEGWKTGDKLSGWVFLSIDNIDTRRAIIQDNLGNEYIKGYCDIRMGLTNGQIYFVENTESLINQLLGTMNFTHEEAKVATPVSACGLTLSVIPTIKFITSVAIANWVNCLNKQEYKNFMLTDAFYFILDSFTWKA